MADSNISEAMRAIALKRWADASPEERSRNTAAANAANRTRPRKKTHERFAELEARIAELEARLAAA
ncbi:hypothetical protein [Dactylosporangium sp. CA-139066]|uniref:hypothetical protein n=1 Tax=Dactylosporangium sp. CA-139066 TaxID=3239930 RepID=UPI003D8D9F45